MKAEMFTDLHVKGEKNIKDEIDEYIKFFNEERPAYALGYMTPVQYRKTYARKYPLQSTLVKRGVYKTVMQSL